MADDDVRYLWRQSLHNSSQNPNQRELLDSIRPENYVPPFLRKQESTKKCLVILWIPAPLLSQGQALLKAIQSLPLYAVEQGGKLSQEWKRRFHGELMSFAIRYKSMRLP